MRTNTLGLANIGWVGAALAALALLIFVWTQKSPTPSTPPPSSAGAPMPNGPPGVGRPA